MLDKLRPEFKQMKGALFFNSVFGGGAYTFLLNLSKQFPVLIVDPRADSRSINGFTLQYIFKGEKQDFIVNDLDLVIEKLELEEICVNHLIYSNTIGSYIDLIIDLKHKYNLAIKVYLHDFYSICPSINLLDYKAEFCNIPSNSSCNACLEKYDNPVNTLTFNKSEVLKTKELHQNNILVWRNMWRKLFDEASYFILPSNAAAELWGKAFPEYSKQITILHHDLSYLSAICQHKNEAMLPFYQVYVIGDLAEHKGSGIIHGILELIKINKLNICINIIGAYDGSLFVNTPYLKLHGRFEHDIIANILNNKDINCFIMPSICPETFSYVTQEMMATGLPIIAFNLGAQAQFLSKYESGILVDEINPQKVFDEVFKLYQSHKQLMYDGLFNSRKTSVINDFIRKYELCLIENEKLYALLRDNQLKDKLSSVEREFNCVKQELKNVYNSKSWQVTKSLRIFMRFLKR